MKVFNITIVAIALGGILSGCAAPQGSVGILDAPTPNPSLDNDRGVPVAQWQSRLVLPVRPLLSAPRIFRKEEAPGRLREVYLYDLTGFIQFQRIGLLWLDERRTEGYSQLDDPQFRSLGKVMSRKFTYVPFDNMKIETRGAVKYAAFRSDHDRPCVLFSRPIGEKKGAARAGAMIIGSFCDSSRYGTDELKKLVTYYVGKITLRENAVGAR
ncbi:hypothetical protein [Varunaivibrio sulfuroxidans]|uniref:Lipoprotein n=1 Tax=Varunaivibrio sulfuroxidans TaxID=1773489 RepID=A0A4R3JH88_9PROT|nr:hypothetical protein [Varunaivibrio sulfuroxidans]TCS64150.1 hypothetical protein EDD55_102192 [Varunaivibrio sulfuroxidans]WES31403.1 hypothetical protein P3M64_03250 [Varunaivibrio sulfuroxidans]